MEERPGKDIFVKRRYERSILVVDRSAPMRDLLCEGLRREGWWVTSCSDGQMAVSAAGLIVYDVVLIDFTAFNMPPAGGAHVAEKLRKLNPQVRIVGTGFPDQRKLFLDAGADEFLPKPYDVDTAHKIGESADGKTGRGSFDGLT